MIKAHPAADVFPQLDEPRYASLKDDIAAQGLLHPIVLYDGQILDGRHRYRACRELKLEPTTVEYRGNPWAYVWSANGERRDLNADQRYLIWAQAMEGSAAWAAEAVRRHEAGNRARSEATQQQHATSNPRAGEKSGGPTTCGPTITGGHNREAAASKAAASHTNRGTVERMDQLRRHRPDLAAQVVSGEMRPAEAMRQMKRDTVAERVAALPEGKYRVIYADPPWSYGNSGAITDADHYSRVERHYPSMPLADLCALPVAELAADDAVLFLWVPVPLAPEGLKVMKAWGFDYKTMFVWDKQRHNFGHYSSVRWEGLYLGTRGSCLPDADKLEPSVVSVPRGRHSEKPAEFRAMIDRMYLHGPRVELFARGEAPDGWQTWGNEA